MVGVAANHRADRRERIEASRLRHPLQRERDLQRTGNGNELGLGAGFLQLGARRGEQRIADFLVEPGMHHPDPGLAHFFSRST
jgi:hypothetical protein